MKLTGRLGPEEFWNQYDRKEALVLESSTDIPCYAVSPWSGPVAVGEWDLGSRPPAAVSLVHGTAAGPSVQTWTTTQDPRTVAGLRRMAAGGPPAGGLSDTPDPLLPEPDEVLIPVDGVNVPFRLWRSADRWWADAQHGGFGLVVEGHGLEPGALALHRALDIQPYLHGRRAQLRILRGEA
jgi:hypothetical protein